MLSTGEKAILSVHSCLSPRIWGHKTGCLLTDFPCGPLLILVLSKKGSDLLLGHHCLESLLVIPFISLQIQVLELVESLIHSLAS